MKELARGKTREAAAAVGNMSSRTLRTYLRDGRLPGDRRLPHDWLTRTDPFAEVWPAVAAMLNDEPGLLPITLFQHLQRQYPGRFPDGQLRTLQRRIKRWRALEGPAKAVFFAQEHRPGEIGASDFTNMNALGITINGEPFPHLLYHFTLTYSNWEAGMPCASESFESLSEGLQQALWQLGGIPQRHRTDSLTAAVRQPHQPDTFTRRYDALLTHYGLAGEHTRPRHPNENGDIESRNGHLKRTVEQRLLLRGSRDFISNSEYERFLAELFASLNSSRREKVAQERACLRPMPATRLPAFSVFDVRVGAGSLLRVKNHAYSVPSRFCGEIVRVHLFSDRLEVWYAQRRILEIPRVLGNERASIRYADLLDALERKPGAFANYRYREFMFPNSRFRQAYDTFLTEIPRHAAKSYLALLRLAVNYGESRVDDALRVVLDREEVLTVESIRTLVASAEVPLPPPTAVTIMPVDLRLYDGLLYEAHEEACAWTR